MQKHGRKVLVVFVDIKDCNTKNLHKCIAFENSNFEHGLVRFYTMINHMLVAWQMEDNTNSSPHRP